MKREVGLWIDHRKTVMVTIENEVEVVREIRSNMEKHVRFTSGAPSKSIKGIQGSTAEDVRDRQFGNQLNSYYDDVIACLRGAESIQIFGPGEAKGELETRLEKEGLKGRIIEIETVDKMTDRQIAAKIRKYFQIKTIYSVMMMFINLSKQLIRTGGEHYPIRCLLSPVVKSFTKSRI